MTLPAYGNGGRVLFAQRGAKYMARLARLRRRPRYRGGKAGGPAAVVGNPTEEVADHVAN